MTPMQLVRDECANHQPDGSCLGVMINEDLSITRAAPKPRCLLAEGKRCPYFEACVAPMADMASDPRRAAALLEAVAEYRRVTKQGLDLTRQCPDCDGPVRRGRRYSRNRPRRRPRPRKKAKNRGRVRRTSTIIGGSYSLPDFRWEGVFSKIES